MTTTMTEHESELAPGEQAPAGVVAMATADQEQLSELGASLRTALDGRYAEGRAAGRAELNPEDALRDHGQSMAEARAWTFAKLQLWADRGLANAGFPIDGKPADTAASVIAFETLAHGDLSLTIKSGVQFGLWGGAVQNLGTAYHLAEWLPKIVSLELPGCFAMTEVGHGSDVQNLETTVSWDRSSKEFVIDSPRPTATKTYIGNAALDGRMAAVFGQLVVNGTNHGIHVVMVPLRDADNNPLPGVNLGDNGHKGGLLGIDNGTISFDQVRVPREYLLNRYGGVSEDGEYVSAIASDNARFFTMLGTLVRGRVCVGASAGITARKALSIATRYAEQRRQFPAPGSEKGVLLMDYLSHQRKLLPAIATSYALGFAHNESVEMLVRVQEAEVRDDLRSRELEARAAALKVMHSRFANDTVQMCREACGGAGFISENGLTTLRRDVDVFATFEGDNTVLEQLVTKAQLLEYRQMWGDLDMLGTVQQAASMVGRTVMERSTGRVVIERLVSAAKRRTGEVPVRDRGWHAWMFEEREQHVVEGLANRMRAARKTRGQDAFDAYNALQDHMVYAARVHTERVVLDAFIVGVESCEDEATHAVLNRLCDLYALSRLEADRGWFLEHNRMSASRSKRVVRTVTELCSKLRPDALALVEGLGIPEKLLDSQMLLTD